MSALTSLKIRSQRNLFNFFADKYVSGKAFTKGDLAAITQWKGQTLSTYWSKQFAAFLVPDGQGRYRVSEAFRRYATWEAFRDHVTQVRSRSAPDYTLLRHDTVLIYEFFMPLTNETQLRAALDDLFYKDTILKRISELDSKEVRQHFIPQTSETHDKYTQRLCTWLSSKFSGYSISTVSGRFRVEELLSMQDAVTFQKSGRRYLFDETTAIVRFVFHCGEPARLTPFAAVDDSANDASADNEVARREAAQIRWFFNALFVRTIIQAVNAEAEIWMVESGIRSRLYIWKVEKSSNARGSKQPLKV